MILQEFLKDFPNAITVNMGMNYRCYPKIVKASSIVISENKMRLQKKLESKETAKKGSVFIKKWQERKEMYSYMVGRFKEFCEEERDKSAVLFRTNQEAQMFAMNMLRENIPYSLKDKSMSVYEHFVVKDIMAFLLAAKGDRRREIFLRILNKPRTNIGRESLETEIVDLNKLIEFYQNPYMSNREAAKDVEKLVKHLQRLSKMKMSMQIRYIRMAMEYESYLQRRAGENRALFDSWLELLDWLQEEAEQFDCLEKWMTFQKEYDRNVQCGNQKGVHIMTIHASKGLEFDYCYILNVNEGNIPQYRRGQKLTASQMEEERRIFYVGMTRAKKTLELHYLTGTKERPKFPSRFIHRLSEK